jgi:transcriptional regulator with XRE-family HTH domain
VGPTGKRGRDRGEGEAALEVGRRFRERRLELDQTQAEVAAKAGLHRSTIGALERGATHVGLVTVVLTALALGRGPESMIGGIRWEPGPEPGAGTWHIEPAPASVYSE